MTWKEARSIGRDATGTNTVDVDNGKRFIEVVLTHSPQGLWAAQESFAQVVTQLFSGPRHISAVTTKAPQKHRIRSLPLNSEDEYITSTATERLASTPRRMQDVAEKRHHCACSRFQSLSLPEFVSGLKIQIY